MTGHMDHSEWACYPGHERFVGDRIFHEGNQGLYDPEAVRSTHDGDNWTFVVCPGNGNEVHWDTVVIAVDGGCRNNGYSDAQGALGVYVGDNSQFNQSELLSPNEKQTNQRAELRAGLEALQVALAIEKRNPPDRVFNSMPPPQRNGPLNLLSRVVVKTDSRYLQGAMTDWIYKWRGNGYRDAKGSKVDNRDLFKKLERSVEELNAKGVEVNFWHVLRNRNQKADKLVNDALNG